MTLFIASLDLLLDKIPLCQQKKRFRCWESNPVKLQFFVRYIYVVLKGRTAMLVHTRYRYFGFFYKNGPFPASFSLFLSFQYTVDSKQMFDINKFLLMTGFDPQTSGIGSDRSTN